MAKTYDELGQQIGRGAARYVKEGARTALTVGTAVPRAVSGVVTGAVDELTKPVLAAVPRLIGSQVAGGLSRAAASPAAAITPTAVTPAPTATPTFGPRIAPSATPVDMSQSGYGITAPTPVSPLAPPTLAATRVAPAVRSAPPAAEDWSPAQFGGATPTTQPARVAATNAMDMTSYPAMRLRAQMDGMNSADARGVRPGSARWQQLASQWEEAGRKAFVGAMTPQQRAAYDRQEMQYAVQQGEAFKQSPQYLTGEQGVRTAIGVADAQARGMTGAAGTKAEQDKARLAAEAANTQATLASEEKRNANTVGEQSASRKEVAEMNNRTRAEDSLVKGINAAYKNLESITEGTAAYKSALARIATLEAQHNKMLGIEVGGVVAGGERQYSADEASKLPAGTVYVGTDGRKYKR